jgi:sugar/nucleoside kinase (ribokinase family)
MYDVIVIGDILTDRILQITDPTIVASIDETKHIVSLPYPSKTQLTHPPLVHGGGNAYNMSIAMSKLGLNTALYSMIGNDESGQLLGSELKEHKVNTDLVQIDPANSTNSSYILSIRGDRVLFSYHYTRPYQLPDLPETKYVVLTSMGEDDKQLFENLVAQKQKHNFQLVFSPGTRQIREPFADIKEVLANTDVLILNKSEAKELSRLHTQSNEYLLHALQKVGPKIVVITRSSHGSIASVNHEIIKVGALPVDVIESTGAGDTYAATLIAGLCKDQDLKTAMEWGSMNAANVVSQVGCVEAMLDLAGLEAMHANNQAKLTYIEPLNIEEDGEGKYEVHTNGT